MFKSKRGGKRPGAGRPRIYDRQLKMVSFRLPEDCVEWLDSQPNKTQSIVSLIRQQMNGYGD